MLSGTYSISKEITFSLQGLLFLNNCLDFNEESRLGWNELVNHSYLKTDSKDYLQFDILDAVSSICSTNKNSIVSE